MHADRKNDQQPDQKPVMQEHHINLSEYAGDEDDYKIASEEATTYCEDCERAIGSDNTSPKDTAERERP